MLILYTLPTCPFCERVLKLAENLHIDLTIKDIDADDDARAALREAGGKEQVPYLVDTERAVSMYESVDIVEYLREHYAQSGGSATTAEKGKVHVSNSVCESCEG